MNGNEKFLGYKRNWGTRYKRQPAGITLSDEKIPVDVNNDFIADYYKADIVSAQDYYPFGMMQPGRHFSTSKYTYSFNGKLRDDNVYGKGNFYNYGFRMYDSRLGRFMSVDPLTKKYPWLTPYQFASNTPIQAVDLDGKEAARVVFPEGVSYKQRNATFKQMSKSAGKTLVGMYYVGMAIFGIAQPEFGIPWALTELTGVPVIPSPQAWSSLGSVDEVANLRTAPLTKVSRAEGIVQRRMTLAKNFYRKAGYSSEKAASRMKGIDFNNAVQTKTLKEGTIVQQWVGKNGKIGNYYTTLENGTAKNLGIKYKGRVLKQFKLDKDVKVLKSTANDLGGRKGGGTQFFSPDLKNNVEPLK